MGNAIFGTPPTQLKKIQELLDEGGWFPKKISCIMVDYLGYVVWKEHISAKPVFDISWGGATETLFAALRYFSHRNSWIAATSSGIVEFDLIKGHGFTSKQKWVIPESMRPGVIRDILEYSKSIWIICYANRVSRVFDSKEVETLQLPDNDNNFCGATLFQLPKSDKTLLALPTKTSVQIVNVMDFKDSPQTIEISDEWIFPSSLGQLAVSPPRVFEQFRWIDYDPETTSLWITSFVHHRVIQVMFQTEEKRWSKPIYHSVQDRPTNIRAHNGWIYVAFPQTQKICAFQLDAKSKLLVEDIHARICTREIKFVPAVFDFATDGTLVMADSTTSHICPCHTFTTPLYPQPNKHPTASDTTTTTTTTTISASKRRRRICRWCCSHWGI